ncbi:ATP-binding protein [Kineococcus terrestris]|uniref:ATP-binding protein n=1 Tax=Kineococcus terrestris TaxID=2044856 RepID=UPI0034DACBAF
MERLSLDAHLSSPALARHWVCERCPAEHLPEARRWIAELLTSELVSNALEHGQGPVTLTMTHDAEGIVVGISDGTTSIPALRPQSPTATSGRGIALVDALATAWGYYPSAERPGADGDRDAGGAGDAPAGGDGAAGAVEDVGDPAREVLRWPLPREEESAAPAAGGAAGDRPGRGGKTVWFHLARD